MQDIAPAGPAGPSGATVARKAASPRPLRARRRLYGRALAIAAAVILAGLAAWWQWGRGSEVGVTRPVRGDAAEVVYATGNVEPVRWAKVAALERKRIVEICDCEGRRVTEGTVLARLDDAEERAILAELQARLARYKADAERLRKLAGRGITPETSYQEKITQVEEYEARVAAQRQRIGDLVLKAPMDGVVLRKDGEVGEIAGTGAGDVLFWVGEPQPLRVTAEVSEEDIASVRRGQSVLLRHEGHAGEPLTATVGETTPMGDPDAKTFRVYLDLPADTPLRIGMSVEANIVVREAKDVMLVPAEAIGNGGVLVVEDGRVRQQAIETGIRGTRMVEVRGGLAPAALVVTPYDPALAEGSRVRARGSEAGAP